jgi:hypothetical protein
MAEITKLGLSLDRKIMAFGTNDGEFCIGVDLRS